MNDNATVENRSWSLKAEGGEATLYIYDVIGGLWGGVDAEQVARSLAAFDGGTIHVRINSPGGDVFDAVAIATALRQHPAEVVAHVDGLAASAATSVALAAGRIEIAANGMWMIHNAWSLAIGDKSDMLAMAALLEKVDGNIRRDYEKKTGRPEEEITQWMDEETWFTAEEAAASGFVDELVADQAANRARQWNLSAYTNPPKINEHEYQEPDLAALRRKLAVLENCSA